MNGLSTIRTSANGSPPLQMQGRKLGEQAARLAGLAAWQLGWRPDEFWQATPAELAAAFQFDAVEPAAGEDLRRLREQFPDG